MATSDYELAPPPTDIDARQRWLQHAAGFILMQDIRQYAREQVADGLSDDARAAAHKGIDDALYGLMMVIEGVSGGLANERQNVFIDFTARLVELAKGRTTQRLTRSTCVREFRAGTTIVGSKATLVKYRSSRLASDL